jgi:nicotinamide riboside transporter PnuC
MNDWLSNNYIEIFGAVTGIIYVFLEIRQTIWLWPLGLVTSGVYVWIFFSSKLYADMSLQVYYVVISVLGWYWWIKGSERRAQSSGQKVPGEGQRAQSGEQGASSKEQVAEEENSPFESALADRRSQRGQGDVLIKGAINLNETERGRNGEGEKKELAVTHLKLKTGVILFIVFNILYFIMWLVLSRLTDSPVPGWDAFLTSLSIIATWMLARKIYEHWFLWIVVNSVSVILYFSRDLYPTVVLYFVYLAMSFIGLIAWKKTIREGVKIKL